MNNAAYDDYMSFLCTINGSGPIVFNYTGQSCWASYNSSNQTTTTSGADLNLPSITIATLNGSRTVDRTVTNVATDESYAVGWSAPYGVSVKVTPTHFSVSSGQKQVISVSFNATLNNSVASFGRIGLFGNQGHVVNIPLSVIVKISWNSTTNSTIR